MFGSYRRRGGWPVVASLSAIALAACGSSAAPGGVPASVAAQMHASLAQVGRGVQGGDRSGALSALTAFATDVARQHRAGHVTAAEYAGLQTGIARVRRRIASTPRSRTTPATTSRTTPATTSPTTSAATTATTPAATSSTTPAPTSSTTPAATSSTTPATPATTVAPAPAPSPAQPAPGNGHSHGQGDGHGHGKAKDNAKAKGTGKAKGKD